MTNVILLEADGSYDEALVRNSKKSFEEIKAAKEVNGRVAHEVTDEQFNDALNGGAVQLVDGQIEVQKPTEESRHVVDTFRKERTRVKDLRRKARRGELNPAESKELLEHLS